MTKKDKALIAEALNQICAYVGAIASLFGEPEETKSRDRPKAITAEAKQPEDATPTEVPAAPTSGLSSTSEAPDPEHAETISEPAAATKQSEAPVPTAEPTPAPELKPAPPAAEIKYEDVRAILAEKARSGYRAEVKALLTAHGISQLSDADPAVYAQLLAEAEAFAL